ncbi:MAG: hypothetical protein WCO02_18440, partial [Bacteroidota bacterium]
MGQHYVLPIQDPRCKISRISHLTSCISKLALPHPASATLCVAPSCILNSQKKSSLLLSC